MMNLFTWIYLIMKLFSWMYLIMKLFTNPHRCHQAQNTFKWMCDDEDVCATRPVSAHPEHRADCFYCTLSFNQALDSLNHQMVIKREGVFTIFNSLMFRHPAQSQTHSAQVVFYLTNVFKKKPVSTAPAMPHLYERLRACQEQVGWQRRIRTRHEFLKNEHGTLSSIARLMSWR